MSLSRLTVSSIIPASDLSRQFCSLISSTLIKSLPATRSGKGSTFRSFPFIRVGPGVDTRVISMITCYIVSLWSRRLRFLREGSLALFPLLLELCVFEGFYEAQGMMSSPISEDTPFYRIQLGHFRANFRSRFIASENVFFRFNILSYQGKCKVISLVEMFVKTRTYN